jgi:quercetin dioxygenase-like cupin family protein
MKSKRPMSALAALVAAMAVLALSAFVAVTKASSPSGVTPTVLARGTFESFKVKSDQHGSIPGLKAKSKHAIDLVVRRHDYLPHSSTGWHGHPGPVFITVTQGRLTFYEADDPTCTPHVVSAGQGYVDSGAGHIGRNETDAPAQDISVITAPVGGVFRTELPAPNPNCGF